MQDQLTSFDKNQSEEAQMKQAKLNKTRAKILKFLKCPLKDAATNLVFGNGNPNTKLMFIGEAPGKNEDLQGLPFVGAAGKQLNKLLNSINLTLNDIYIANILKYRPPNNRDPLPDEIRKHTPYLIEQIDIIQPKVIATLGNFSTKFVLAKFRTEDMKKIPGIGQLHGQPREITIENNTYTVIPLYHPAAMLYRPQLRDVLETDFRLIQKHL